MEHVTWDDFLNFLPKFLLPFLPVSTNNKCNQYYKGEKAYGNGMRARQDATSELSNSDYEIYNVKNELKKWRPTRYLFERKRVWML